jgi:hypothetical protein
VAHDLQAAEKCQKPLACARGSENTSRVCKNLPSRDREGAVVFNSFSAACFIVLLPAFSRQSAEDSKRRTEVRRGTLNTLLKK